MTDDDFISASALAALLAKRLDEPSRLASKLLQRLAPDGRLRLAVQPAGRKGTTLKTKYTLALQRGVGVAGLDKLCIHLAELGRAQVRSCVIDGPSTFALVVLNQALTRVGGVLPVTKVLHPA